MPQFANSKFESKMNPFLFRKASTQNPFNLSGGQEVDTEEVTRKVLTMLQRKLKRT